MKLETERLILRNYKITDIEDYWEYVSQEKVGPMCGWPQYTDKQKAVERLAIEIAKPNKFAIVWKENNKVIGSVELMDYKPERYETEAEKENSKEMAFLLHEGYWGKGIMPEACRAVMKYAFEKLKVPSIFIGHAEANKQSGRVQEKLGFRITGRRENYREWLDGKTTALIGRKMTRQEYLDNPIYQNLQIKVKDTKLGLLEEKL